MACIIINNQGNVLLQKRAATKRFGPNKYGLCAGHVDSGELLEEAMIREIKEELGIDVDKGELKKFIDAKVNLREINSNIIYYYYIICNMKEEEFKIQKEELSEVKWFDLEKLIDTIKNNDEALVFKNDDISLLEEVKKIVK